MCNTVLKTDCTISADCTFILSRATVTCEYDGLQTFGRQDVWATFLDDHLDDTGWMFRRQQLDFWATMNICSGKVFSSSVSDNCYTCCIVSFQPFTVASINILSYLILACRPNGHLKKYFSPKRLVAQTSLHQYDTRNTICSVFTHSRQAITTYIYYIPSYHTINFTYIRDTNSVLKILNGIKPS